MARGRHPVAGVLLALCLLAGCTEDTPPDRDPAPTVAAEPEPQRAPVREASADGPSAAVPDLSIVGAVDLTGLGPGFASAAIQAVTTRDSTVYVLVSDPDPDRPYQLATVTHGDDGWALRRAVRVPRMRAVWDLQLLADGSVAIAGWFRPVDDGYGFTVVDPVSGDIRELPVISAEDHTSSASGHSAVSADGRTLYLFVGTTVEYRHSDLLFAVDAATGAFRAGIDLFDETRTTTERGVGRFAAALLRRPGGGVVLVYGAVAPAGDGDPVPTLLAFDADLQPVGSRHASGRRPFGETAAATVAGDGTVYAAMEFHEGDWLLEAAPDGPVRRVLELADRYIAYSFVVDPAGRWLLLPAQDGVRAVDLATGAARGISVGCATGYPARYLYPGTGDVAALVIGACPNRAQRIPMLWIIGS